ncbi:MAG: FAD-binding oxidoreductase [Proteobacteria bacterium]|nr:FAD-binding oxidoreductase [Pseudomonadota bacterium]
MAKETGYIKSYYAASANPAPPRGPLRGERICDVCVIGGGYSGLSTALHLAERGHKVIVLEAVKVGFGASGRNGGQIINGYSRDYDTIKGRYGADAANALLSMSFEGGDIIRERVSKYAINCDLKPGSFFAAFNVRQMRDLERRKEVWERAGHQDLHMYSKERMPEVVDTSLYCGGLLDRRGGHIHPLNLALGEAGAIERLGGEIFENTRVVRVERGLKPVAVTENGRVAAKFLIVCGNAYLHEAVPELSSRIMSVSSQIVTTEVLSEGLAHKMMPSGFCLEDCNYLLDYYRMTADHRLLFGGGVVYSGTDPSDIIGRLYPHILKTFPYLKDRKIDFAWSGNFALTLTRMPHIGRLTDTVYFIQGDSGHGVTTCHLLGRLVAEAISQQSSRFDVFAAMRNYPFPGGRMFRVPLTALGALYYALKEQLGI